MRMFDAPEHDDDHVETVDHAEGVDAAIVISFGAVLLGREALAVETFTEVVRYLGGLMADDVITNFRPYFYADGSHGDVIGFFIVEGDRESLDGLRREETFVRKMIRIGAAVANVRVHTLSAGSGAGRVVNIYREVRSELGLI